MPASDDDELLLTDSEAVLYLGFRTKADLLQRVTEGRLEPADRRKGRWRFRLGELRRYSRDTARLTAGV
jgi:hypothetical protein